MLRLVAISKHSGTDGIRRERDEQCNQAGDAQGAASVLPIEAGEQGDLDLVEEGVSNPIDDRGDYLGEQDYELFNHVDGDVSHRLQERQDKPDDPLRQLGGRNIC